MLNTQELGDLAFMILFLVPWDTKLVCNLDVIFPESVEDCGGMW
jgi:hypothetical protein